MSASRGPTGKRGFWLLKMQDSMQLCEHQHPPSPARPETAGSTLLRSSPLAMKRSMRRPAAACAAGQVPGMPGVHKDERPTTPQDVAPPRLSDGRSHAAPGCRAAPDRERASPAARREDGPMQLGARTPARSSALGTPEKVQWQGRALSISHGTAKDSLGGPVPRGMRDRAQGLPEASPMECPVEGHCKSPAERLKHVSSRLEPLLAGFSKASQDDVAQFRVFGANAMLACTAVQLCKVLSSSNDARLRAGALWGIGSALCELTDIQNFIGGDSTIMGQVFSAAITSDAALQSCAAYAIACLARLNTKMQNRAIRERELVLKFAEVLQNSTNPAVLFSNLQAVGNICFNNLRAQQQFASDGVLSTVNALCHARDRRISQTACRCRATFLQLLAREPDARVTVSQQAPFDRSCHESTEDSGRSWSEVASPSGPRPSRPSSSSPSLRFSLRSDLSLPLRRQRPDTSKGRLNSETASASKVEGRQPLPSSTLPAAGDSGSTGWVPVKHLNTCGLGIPGRPTPYKGGGGSYSIYQSQPFSAPTSIPSMSVRRIPTSGDKAPFRGISVEMSTVASLDGPFADSSVNSVRH